MEKNMCVKCDKWNRLWLTCADRAVRLWLTCADRAVRCSLKGKVHPTAGHEGPEGSKVIALLFL